MTMIAASTAGPRTGAASPTITFTTCAADGNGTEEMTKKSTQSPDTASYRKVVPAGDYWIHKVRAGQIFRIVDLEGNQAADTLFYSAADPAERYSAVDTIR